ncbi:MAG: hypothetical protein AAF399_16275 [Bacteroidota bacterium]
MTSSTKRIVRFLIELLIFLPLIVLIGFESFGIHPLACALFLIGLKVYHYLRPRSMQRARMACLDDIHRYELIIASTERAIEEEMKLEKSYQLIELKSQLASSKTAVRTQYAKLRQLDEIVEGSLLHNRD